MQQDTPSAVSPATALAALLSDGRRPAPEPSLLADRPDGTVVRVGDAVAKAHAPGTDPDALVVRLRIAAAPALHDVLLPPTLPVPAGRLDDGRYATAWPYGRPVDPDDPEAAPWEAAGALLGRLHRAPLSELARGYGPLPAMRGPAKAAAALARLRTLPQRPAAGGPSLGARLATARGVLERAWAGLPAWCRGEEEPPGARPRALCHGDFHLGQLVRHPAPAGDWRLIDIDDLGVGDPAWDLARPAAWYAAGLLPPAAWERLLTGYLAVLRPSPADLWAWLDHPARALTVQTAATAVAKAARERRGLDENEEALLAACSRIVELPGPARP